MKIRKKIWTDCFDDVASGRKKFELRLADFKINPGDTLVLEEWDPMAGVYTGRKIETTATYVLKSDDCPFWSDDEIRHHGLQVIQIEVIK